MFQHDPIDLEAFELRRREAIGPAPSRSKGKAGMVEDRGSVSLPLKLRCLLGRQLVSWGERLQQAA